MTAFPIIGAAALLVQVALYLAISLGAPLARLTLGGKYRTLPKEYRGAFLSSTAFQALFLIVLLLVSGLIPSDFNKGILKAIGALFALFLSFNAVKITACGHYLEKRTILPLTIIAAICYWVSVAWF